MTEKEAIQALRLEGGIEISGNMRRITEFFEGLDTAIKALEEIEQYKKIGTVDECRAAVEKLPVAEEAIRKLLCSEYGSSCQFCIQDSDKDARCCKVGGSGSWCCENAKWNGRLE